MILMSRLIVDDHGVRKSHMSHLIVDDMSVRNLISLMSRLIIDIMVVLKSNITYGTSNG